MNAKHLLNVIRNEPSISSRLPVGKFKNGEEVRLSQLTVNEVKALADRLKLPSYTVLRLYDLVVYSKLDKVVQSLFNPPSPGIVESHKVFRLTMKRRFYLRNLRDK